MKGGILQASVTLLLWVQHFSSCSRGPGGTVTGTETAGSAHGPRQHARHLCGLSSPIAGAPAPRRNGGATLRSLPASRRHTSAPGSQSQGWRREDGGSAISGDRALPACLGIWGGRWERHGPCLHDSASGAPRRSPTYPLRIPSFESQTHKEPVRVANRAGFQVPRSHCGASVQLTLGWEGAGGVNSRTHLNLWLEAC